MGGFGGTESLQDEYLVPVRLLYTQVQEKLRSGAFFLWEFYGALWSSIVY